MLVEDHGSPDPVVAEMIYYPVVGWASGDHQRAQQLTSFISREGSTIMETGLVVNAYSTTGYAAAFANSTSYAANQVISNQERMYKAASACMSASSGSGPTGTGTGIVNGTCSFSYVTDEIANGKQAANFFHVAEAGAGHVWGEVTAMVVQPSWNGGFAAGHEVDFTNNSGVDCMTCQTLFVTGTAGANKIGAGVSLYNSSVSNYAYEDSIKFNGAKLATRSNLWDNTTSNYSLYDQGTHLWGINLSGNYSGGGILSRGSLRITADNNGIDLFPSSSSNLNRWRIVNSATGSGAGKLYLIGSNDNFASNFTNALVADLSGRVGIGNPNPAYALDVVGVANATAYRVGGVQGVSCPAGTVNPATMVVTSGIITHC